MRLRHKTGMATLLAALLLAGGCSGVGQGNALETLELRGVRPVSDPEGTYRVFECLFDGARLTGVFTNGGVGDFTSRAQYTSSNPDVLRASNGDIPIPGLPGQNLQRGTLVPVAPGTATVTAEFVGLSASLDTVVAEIGDIVIEPVDPTLALGSSMILQARAFMDGIENNVGTSGVWSLDPENDEVATIAPFGDSAGRVTARGVGGPLTASVRFDNCDRTLSTEVRVAEIDSLIVEKEFDGGNDLPATDELVTGTSEAFRVLADFGDDSPRQDLTGQSLLTSSAPQVARFSVLAGARNILEALGPGVADVTARFGSEDDAIDSDPVQIMVVDATLEAFDIQPRELSFPSGCLFQLRAIGHFDSDTRQQEITRHVLWTSSDAAVARTFNGLFEGGLVRALAASGEVTVTATNENATVRQEDEITVTVDADAECPS